ncbi:MAG TPA: alkaline phosphatase family protein [Candidatus Angelobacter sp.]|nr:alkaline phosphatase family protein [Candidatus Angelobacter sp.]
MLSVIICLLFPCFSQAQAPVPHSSHVVMVMDENTSYGTALAQMPWLVGQGAAYGHTTNYISNTTGSLMAYLWMASGSCHSAVNCALPAGTHDFGCSGDSCTSPITDNNIFREMNNRGISWKVYAQSYAAAGGTVTTPDNAKATTYYRRHNGATWYSDILSNVAGSQAKIVDFSQFATDLANNALPQFSIIAPDGMNDGHDGGPVKADAFLKANLPALLAQPYFQPGGDGLLLINFDNGDADAAGPVYAAIIGPNVSPNSVSNSLYKHENTFRTILDALGIPVHPGASATAGAMNDFFSGYVTVSSPTQNAITGTQVLVNAAATESSTQIYQLQVWDQATGQKLAESAPGSSTFQQALVLLPGKHQLVVEDIAAGNFRVLHKSIVAITVQPDGVNVASPLANAVSGPLVLVIATATEPTPIHQLQVWDDTAGVKLGESAPGTSTINQTFSLAPGTHRIVVEDISTGTYQTMHKTLVNVTVLADGVFIASPASNTTVGAQVPVSASARESAASIYQLQVWDNTTGKKLGESAPGTSIINQTFTLTPGLHEIVVEDITTGTFQPLHQSSIMVNSQVP